MQASSSAESLGRSRGKAKILLVDDTPENLVSLEAALSGLDQELVSVRSGRDALMHLLRDDFAAILLDVKMPDMDGLETAELIRSRERSRHTPILFLTGYKSDEKLFRGYDLGAVDFLFKPIVPEILRSKVNVFVQLSRNATLLQEQAEELRHQTAVLRKAEHTFRSLLEAAPDAIVMSRENGEIVMANSKAESLFEQSRSNIVGRNIRTFVPDWHFELLPPPDEDPDNAVLNRGDSAVELTTFLADRTTFPVEISASLLRSEDGLMIISAIRDITERKKAESEIDQLNAYLKHLNTHLEDRIRERTQDLLRSNRELQQFAYVASHDLQEPLRTVSIFTQLLVEKMDEAQRESSAFIISTILENARRMENLVHDLLDFSNIERRGKDYFKTLHLPVVVGNSILNLQSSIQESGASITVGDLPTITGDELQLTRLFQNLLSNSIKYRSDRPVEISIGAIPTEQGWAISVRDNGIGIEPRYAEKVFGIFKRLHERERYPGNGMGLAICRQIVEQHGGHIWVDPEYVSGACVHISLPSTAEETTQTVRQDASGVGPSATNGLDQNAARESAGAG